MVRRQGVVVATTPERLISLTLSRILPAAAASYEQCLIDLAEPRRSYRGVAHELREVLRETLHYLAPDAEVMAQPGFKLEPNQPRPTHAQKALFILKKRGLSKEETSVPELTVSMIEELGAKITRTAYSR